MRRRFIAVITTILIVYLGINYYIGWHGLVFLQHTFGMTNPWPYWIVFWIVSLGYLLARLAERFVPYFVFYLLKAAGSYWFAILMYAVLLLPMADVAALLLNINNVPADEYVPGIGYIILGILALLLAVGSWNAWRPIVRTYEIKIDKPAGQLKTMRIAVASDLHLGTIVRNKHLQGFVERINALNPDLILLPGDIIDDDIKPFIQQNMAETMRGLKAKHGVYAVLGNHEYIGGHVDEFVERLQQVGIQVLLDRSVQVADSLYIVGRKDRSADSARFGSAGRLKLGELLSGVDLSHPVILMDHQPYHLDLAAAAGVDVMLSGHTHRGQMTPNHFITRRLFELDWGYKRKDTMHAIVSSGLGFWGPPIRLGSRSEIIELIITFDDKA
ncbi:metallophosphoesterase [Paenibacillus abyssi]|uniref:Phosphoesterase n=1 Tax=Paenibacillus abyssi TaxID=1340531 RepID=A0A917CKG4_9BACL|nr:metallophosphoesterase [Paenibacillus abyssi]GGF91196.1 phosphoesterase [Paenibacillus abyssi]